MTTATRLARRFDASRSCLRGGHDRSTGFDAWLAACWSSTCPPEPDTCPDAVSLLDGYGRRAIRWYELDNEVLGYLPGLPSRCYRVPGDAVEPPPDGVLDEDGPVCEGDDREPPDRFDRLVAARVELVLEPADRSGRDRLPARDFFHRQPEGDRQVVG
jgi:hypothetical protein